MPEVLYSRGFYRLLCRARGLSLVFCMFIYRQIHNVCLRSATLSLYRCINVSWKFTLLGCLCVSRCFFVHCLCVSYLIMFM